MGAVAYVFGAIAVALLATVAHLFPYFDVTKAVVLKNDGECGRKMTKFPGFEDIAYLTANVAVSCSNDNHKMFGKDGPGPEGTPDVAIERLEFSGFPSERVAFHPHGIYVARPDGWTDALENMEDHVLLPLLYVVNHAYTRGGERIEVFAINWEDKRLNYLRSITHPLLDGRAYGVLNDLVVKGFDSEIFVTVWKTNPFPKKGRFATETFSEKLQHALALPYAVLTKTTELIRCDISDTYNTNCNTALSGFGMANGITHDKRFDNLFVVDLTTHELVIVDVSLSSADTFKARHGYRAPEIKREPYTLSPLKKVGTLPLKPNTVDNIEMHPWRSTNDTTVMFGGSIVRVIASIEEGIVPSPGGITRYEATRTAVVGQHGVGKAFVMSRAEDVVVHNGTKFCGVSAGVVLGAEGGKEVAVMGSYKDRGVFLCAL